MNNLSYPDMVSSLTNSLSQLTNRNDTRKLENEVRSVFSSTRDDLLADRAHTEMREDTAYQRGVADMRAAGLNPYTIGSNPAPSSSSSVGADVLSNKLSMLGYVLDLKNLDFQNRKLANETMTSILRTVGTTVGLAL